MKDKLEGNQARPGSGCLEEPSKEVKYLKKNVKLEHEPIDTSEAEFLKKVVDIRHKIKRTEGGEALKLSFVQVTVKGKRFATLVDTGATHSFLSRKAAKSFGKKAKMEKGIECFQSSEIFHESCCWCDGEHLGESGIVVWKVGLEGCGHG